MAAATSVVSGLRRLTFTELPLHEPLLDFGEAEHTPPADLAGGHSVADSVDDVGGLAVYIGARVSGLAAPGEVLVGKAVRMQSYWERADALEAVGLSEQDARAEAS